MLVTIIMKNVRLRDGNYEFRMRVPKDCLEAVGKSEVTQSLKTSIASKADVLSKKLTADWRAKFKEIRTSASGATKKITAKTDDTNQPG